MEPCVVAVEFKKILSHDCGPFWQFVKYGVIGVMATLVQTGVFYVLATTCCKCLTPDDIMVRLLGFASATFSGDEPWYLSRGTLAAVSTAVGFFFACVFCWLMNRKFVFKPGKFAWYVEFWWFFSSSALSTVIALAALKLLIDLFGMETSYAVFVEILVSFCINFAVRKFFIFKG